MMILAKMTAYFSRSERVIFLWNYDAKDTTGEIDVCAGMRVPVDEAQLQSFPQVPDQAGTTYHHHGVTYLVEEKQRRFRKWKKQFLQL